MTWRFPFVSRTEHDARIADHKAALAASDAELSELRADYRDLMQKYHALATPAPAPVPLAVPTVTGTPHEPRPRDPVALAIREEAGSDVRLQAYFRRRAAELKTQGMKPDEIAAELHKWESYGAEPLKPDVDVPVEN